MNSLVSTLLVVLLLTATASQKVTPTSNPTLITCLAQFATLPHFTRVLENIYGCYLSEQRLEVNRVTYIGCRFNLILCSISTTTVIFVAGTILSRLSGSRTFLKAGHSDVRPRGRYNSIVATLEPVRDDLLLLNPAQASATRMKVTDRGRNLLVKEYMSELSLNNTRSSKGVATNLHLVSQELQPRGRYEAVLDNDIHSEVNVPDLLWEPSNIFSQRSHSTVNKHQSNSSQVIWDYVLTYLNERFAGLLGELSWSNISPYQYIFRVLNTHLLRSLYGWRPPLFVLVIAADDAVHDHDFLELALEPLTLEGVNFAGLATEVTFSRIDAAVRRLYDKSMMVPGSELFIHLTGHGNSANGMILSGDERMSEAALFSLLQAVQRGYSTLTPITVLFDICRPALVMGSVAPNSISSIWSCHPGERAGACRFPGFNTPNSCLLIALMMAACTPGLEYTMEVSKRLIQERLDQLTTYLRGLHDERHSSGRCIKCSDAHQRCVEPMSQSVDWRDAKNMDGLFGLMKVLSGTTMAEQVYQRFTRNENFRRLNKISGPRRLWPVDQANEGSQPGLLLAAVTMSSPALDFIPLPGDKYEQGANEVVYAM